MIKNMVTVKSMLLYVKNFRKQKYTNITFEVVGLLNTAGVFVKFICNGPLRMQITLLQSV
jgi:hypothetical protein